MTVLRQNGVALRAPGGAALRITVAPPPSGSLSVQEDTIASEPRELTAHTVVVTGNTGTANITDLSFA